MKLLKKPFVALLLSAAVVLSSTLLSVNIRFGGKCRDITDGFYDGVYYNGYTQKSLSSHLKNICGYADGLVTIANNYDIDTGDLLTALDDLKLSLSYSYGYASHIYFCYDELLSPLNALVDQLSRTELSERDADGFVQYRSGINGAQRAMESAGYNESVREFLRSHDQFPTDFLAELAGVEMPEYFA